MLELASTSPFDTTLPQGAGLSVLALNGLGLATMQPLRGQSARVAARIGEALGIVLEDRPGRMTHNGIAAIGTGPGRWLLTAEGEGNQFTRRLRGIVGEAGAVTDQSDGYAVLRLAGPGCRSVLARGVDLDLHPDTFGPGASAVTMIAHMGVILWSVGDDSFDIAVFRSMAGSLVHWLAASIAGAGLALA